MCNYENFRMIALDIRSKFNITAAYGLIENIILCSCVFVVVNILQHIYLFSKLFNVKVNEECIYVISFKILRKLSLYTLL